MEMEALAMSSSTTPAAPPSETLLSSTSSDDSAEQDRALELAIQRLARRRAAVLVPPRTPAGTPAPMLVVPAVRSTTTQPHPRVLVRSSKVTVTPSPATASVADDDLGYETTTTKYPIPDSAFRVPQPVIVDASSTSRGSRLLLGFAFGAAAAVVIITMTYVPGQRVIAPVERVPAATVHTQPTLPSAIDPPSLPVAQPPSPAAAEVTRAEEPRRKHRKRRAPTVKDAVAPPKAPQPSTTSDLDSPFPR
jgi:hypothetical protein